MNERLLDYYSRKDIQKEIVELARNREVGIKYGDRGYGKRPDVLQFPGDVLEVVKQGATSFHVSEERWTDPLILGQGDKKKLDDFRLGWDLLLDVDTKYFNYAKICSKLLADALDFYDVKGYGIKFSGGGGIHIIIPFETFPKFVNSRETRLLFPESTKIVALYLKNMIKDELRKEILKISNASEIMAVTGKKFDDVVKNNLLDPFCIVDIDHNLISSRHLFRAVYSINEKTGLASIPIKKGSIMNFELKMAKIENVKTDAKFLSDEIKEGEATNLMIQAFDWYEKNAIHESQNKTNNNAKIRDYERPKIAVKPDMFPPCILDILAGIKTDGRKRALFLLINFLRKSGYEYEDIEIMIIDWNNKNYESLREGYIKSQITWCKRQKNEIMPPNCDNASYYKDMNVCKPDFFCRNIKNPVQYKKKSQVF